MLGEQAAQRAPGRAVEDHADVAAVGRGRGEQHRLPVVEVAEHRVRDQEYRFVFLRLRGPTGVASEQDMRRQDAHGVQHPNNCSAYLRAGAEPRRPFHQFFPQAARCLRGTPSPRPRAAHTSRRASISLSSWRGAQPEKPA